MANALIRLAPLGFTVLLILWTAIVSPYSKYGDSWAIYPAVGVLPLVLCWHIYLVISQYPRSTFITYGLVHVGILFVIWIMCLMKISKDAL